MRDKKLFANLVNIVADTLDRMTRDSIAHFEERKRDMVKDVYPLARLGVIIGNFSEFGI